MRACTPAWLLVTALLVACGGDGDGVPIAMAGADQRVEVGTAVKLDGAASSDPEGKSLLYSWAITSAPDGSTAKLSNPSAPSASFTPDVDGIYVIALVVNDGGLSSAPASLTVVASLSPQAQADLLLARAAAVSAILTASTGAIHLEWQDTFPEGTTYRVEAEDVAGALTEVQNVPGFGVPSVVLRSGAVPANAVAFRVQAMLPGRSVLLRSAGAATKVVNRFATGGSPQILIDPVEPIATVVRFSLDSARSFGKVTWSLNGIPIGNGGEGVGNPVTRDFAREASGTHRVAARVSVSAELSIDVQRDVRVSNSMPLVNLADGYVEASSVAGIASVSLSVNGTLVGTLTAPNACSPGPRSDLRCGVFPNIRYDRYNLGFTGSTLRSGDYVLVYTVTDRSGQSVQRSSPFNVSNPPTINLAYPPDGALAFGSVRLRGSFIPDQAGTVSVTASLTTVEPVRDPGQALSFRPILSMTGTSIDRDVDLSGIPRGTYWLSVVVRNRGGTAEIKRMLAVTSTQALRHEPLFVGDGFGIAQFVAEGDVVAYRDQNDQVRLVNAATGAAQELGILRTPLIVSGGSLYSSVWMPGCSFVFGDVCLYEWSLSGAAKPLAEGYSAPSFQLVTRGAKVAWVEGSGDRSRIRLYDASRSQSTSVTPPDGLVVVPSSLTTFDFQDGQGQVDVFYAAAPAPLSLPASAEVFGWSSRTGQTRRVSSSGTFNGQVMTDGARVAWWQYPANFTGSGLPDALLSQAVEGGPITTVSLSVLHSVLRDGILAWIESTAAGLEIKASTPTGVRILATSSLPTSGVGVGPGNEESTWLFGTSSGVVVYRQDGRFLAWHAGTNQTRVLMDTANVSGVQVNDGFVFFTLGRSLYRVPLNP